MATHKQEALEYGKFRAGTNRPYTTRGLVVSTVDPLFAGRVKVWIPAIHGPTPYTPTGDVVDESLDNFTSSIAQLAKSGSFKDSKTIRGLPWATVLSHGMGPNMNPTSNITTAAGVFSTPSVGTEVMIMFENNDPTLPVVVGSIIHANEFRYSLARPLEVLPGVMLLEVSQKDDENNKSSAPPIDPTTYPNNAPSVYNIRTSSGSTLFLSDNPLAKSIVLEGSVSYASVSTLTEADKSTLARMYPAFPTTATAAFAKRQILSSNFATPLLANASGASANTDTVSGTAITTITERVGGFAPLTNSNNTGTIQLGLDICSNSKTVNKNYPLSGTPTPSGGADGIFHANTAFRHGKLHSGVDYRAAEDGSTLLLAPVDCYPLYYGPIYGSNPSGYQVSAGTCLLVLGVDGFGQAFIHNRKINPEIIALCSPNKTQLIKVGTVMGICGVTERSSKSTGPHLHWEVFPVNNGASTGIELNLAREAAIGALATIDPVNVWMKQQGSVLVTPSNKTAASSNTNPTTSVITTTPEQAAAFIQSAITRASNDEVNFSKPAGLEMSLTPGKETVTLRHPSGSFISFDPDGNILIYSCGDINFRANRSITYDVLGAIMETSYAKFTRVKTVLKSWARMYSPLKAKDIADTTMPEFFSRVDNSRSIDITNALASTINNSFIIDDQGNSLTPSDLGSASNKPMYVYPANVLGYINYSLSTFDSLLQAEYTKCISNVVGSVVSKVFTDTKTFKAMMLYGSGGKPDFRNPVDDTFGLFAINTNMIQVIKGFSPSASDQLAFVGTTDAIAENNAYLAFQYVVNRFNSVKVILDGLGFSLDNSNITPDDYRYITLLSYKYGDLSIALNEASDSAKAINPSNPVMTYKLVESICTNTLQFSKDVMSYVPTVELIRNNGVIPASAKQASTTSTAKNALNNSIFPKLIKTTGSLTAKQISDASGISLQNINSSWGLITAALDAAGIRSNLVEVAAAATIIVETGNFTPVASSGTAQYFAGLDGRRSLGNNQPGDGYKYRDRGFIQITGRANYTKYGNLLGIDLVNNPDLALAPRNAANILAMYFKQTNIPNAANAQDWLKVRLLVNGGYNGWDRFSSVVIKLLEDIGAA